MALKIKYKGGYKYQLYTGHEERMLPELRGFSVTSDYAKMSNGKLSIRAGYAWDGPSGPSIDTKNFMRGSLVHDALYQLMREGALPQTCRKFADQLLYKHCREDGMFWLRAKWVYWAVKLFAAKAAKTSQRKEVLQAP
jgi:hypothetical protein